MSPTVCGYYGKLPISPEFLRLHAAGPEIRWLDDWLQQGTLYAKAKAGSEWPALSAQADIWNFLFVPEGNDRVVCGAVFPSGDRAGRSFPFLTFLLVESTDVLAAPWLIPLRCRAFLTSARQLLQRLRADLDWNAFRAGVESLPAQAGPDRSIEAGFEDYLSHTTTEEFLLRICPETDRPRHDGSAHQRTISLHRIRDRFRKGMKLGQKVPLVKGHEAETYDLPFWLALQMRLLGPEGGSSAPLFAFWNRAPSNVEPCALLSFGRSSPHLARFMVSPEACDEAWCDWLSERANIQEGESRSSSARSIRTADESTLTLRQHLDRC